MGELSKIVVVVPTYNERDNLPVLAGLLSDLNLPGLELLVTETGVPRDGQAGPSYRNMLRVGFEPTYVRPNYVREPASSARRG